LSSATASIHESSDEFDEGNNDNNKVKNEKDLIEGNKKPFGEFRDFLVRHNFFWGGRIETGFFHKIE